jgi:phosphatidylserine decarboxylase
MGRTTTKMIELMRDTVCVPIHRAGWPFIGAFAAVSLLLWLISPWLGLVGLIATLWCVYFFRDPPRVTPIRDGLIVSPADGRITAVEPARPPQELGLGESMLPRVSIFLSVFDVHVNRIPIDGRIERSVYRPGKFFNAALDKASNDNERRAVLIASNEGAQVGVVQIAGLIARRIVTWVAEGQQVHAGERFGLIRFGSRVDIYLPSGVAALVVTGQRCIAGETVIADIRLHEGSRDGAVR